MKKKLIITTLLSVFVFSFFLIQSSHAQYIGLEDVGSQTNLGRTDVRYTVSRIISNALELLGIVALGIIVYAGFIWMTAGGNDEKVGEAKKWLTRSVIGLAIILSAYSIVVFVSTSLQDATGMRQQQGWSGSGYDLREYAVQQNR